MLSCEIQVLPCKFVTSGVIKCLPFILLLSKRENSLDGHETIESAVFMNERVFGAL